MLSYISIADLRKGDLFIESEYGTNEVYIALEDAEGRACQGDPNSKGWCLRAKNLSSGSEIEFFQAYQSYGYSLNLYLVERNRADEL